MNQSLKQTQSLMMTPQLQQAIKLLTLTHMEMANVISKEMVENPMLEELGADASRDEISKEMEASREISQEDFSGPEIVEGAKDDFDWDKYVEVFNSTSSTPPGTTEKFSQDDVINYENMVSSGTSLTEHLEWQLQMEVLESEMMNLARLIIHHINDEGYLEESLENLVKDTPFSVDEAERILTLVQNLDPLGCGARDLKECLYVQARALEPRVPLVEKMIWNHLEELKNKDYDSIANSIGVEVSKIKDAELIFQNFNPKPGRLISAEQTQFVVPDIYIKEVSGEFVIALNNEGVPRLQISNLYQSLMKSAKSDPSGIKTKEYVQEKLKAAMWLIKSIENRQKTIYKVAEAIIRYQPDFFRKGAAHLKPMILKDIASEIGVHESTVSRVTTNKFVHTPIGTFELKFFFNAGIGGKNGGVDTTSQGLMAKIKDLVSKEPPSKPLSDQKIADILKLDGVIVARRTVAKYREEMGIDSSARRKQKK